jgi:hypothetical protein
LDKALFCGGLRRIAWLSVRSVGAEEWNDALLVANGVEIEHVWNTGRETKCVRSTDGRVIIVSKENITYALCHGTRENEIQGDFLACHRGRYLPEKGSDACHEQQKAGFHAFLPFILLYIA